MRGRVESRWQPERTQVTEMKNSCQAFPEAGSLLEPLLGEEPSQ